MKHFRERVAKQAAKQSGVGNDQAISSRGLTSSDIKRPSPKSSDRVSSRSVNAYNDERHSTPPALESEEHPAWYIPSRSMDPTPTKDSKSLPTTPVKKSLYRPLDFDTFEIRLLRVHRGRQESMIDCSLEYASLINPPEYTALSYRWGDATFLRGHVFIEDWGDVKVTDSLERALKGVRHLDIFNYLGYDKGTLLWVDALCINQQDLLERSQQVRQMRQIYSRAKEVICWVDCQQDEAVEYLIKNHFYGESCETTDRIPMPTYSKALLQRNMSRSDRDSDDPPALKLEKARLKLEKADNALRNWWVEKGWTIMERFFSDEYWRRVWVIQEVAVATEIKLVCGERIIPWEDVVAVWARWTNEPESVPFEARSYLKATHLAEIRHRFQVKREPISLLDAMRWTYQAEATDPRDKIFALLGLCHDGANYVPVPNYKQPLEEIIADMSKGMMSFDRSLDLMCFKGTSLPEEGKLPSWTPNWVNLWSGSLHSMTVHEAAYTDWHTTFSFNPVLYGSTTQILKVEGRFYARITRLTSELARPDPDGQLTLKIEARAPWISSTSSLAKEERSIALPSLGSAIIIRDSIWKTLTMGLLHPEMADNDAALCFSKLWTPEGRGAVHNIALINWLDRNAWFEWRVNRRFSESLGWWSQIGRPLPRWTIAPSSGSAGSKDPFIFEPKRLILQPPRARNEEVLEDKAVRMLDTFIETLEKVLGSGMRLAIATAGELSREHSLSVGEEQIVLAPPAAKESDHVWFVKGCSVPLVLREVVEVKDEVRTVKYKVIGGLYVSDFVRQNFEDEEKWTRGEVVKGLEGASTILNLC